MKKSTKVILITVGVLALLSAAAGLICFSLSSREKKMEASAARSSCLTAETVAAEAKKDMEAAVKEVEAIRIAEAKAEEERRLAEEAARKALEEAKAEEERRLAEEAAKKALEEELAKAEAEKAKTEAEKAASEDVKAPQFLYYRGTPTIKVGDAFDVHKYIGYGDDVDRNVDLTIQGSVDTSIEGTYPLKLTLTDDVGHTTSKDMEVRVVTEISSGGGGGSTAEKEQFSDFVANYKNDDTLVGIDVSRYQGDIDFERVKAAGCEFVYMRIGGYTGGEFFTDRCFVQNFERAKAAGLKIGIYMYTEDSSKEEVQASVKYIMGVLGNEHLDFPIAYDWEDYKHFEEYGMNLHDLNDLLDYFGEEVAKYGYTSCLYGSKNALLNIWTKPRKDPVWLAQYYTSCTYEGEYFMWQHSSSGRIDGIGGDVDLDIYYPNKYSSQQ